MTTLQVSREAAVGAPAELVYGLIRNYQEHHDRFLPTAFSEYRVERGGVGEGTEVSFAVTVGGMERRYHVLVTEPLPGHELVETDLLSGAVTRFLVTSEGAQCRVGFETTWEAAPGLAGLFERWLAPTLMQRLYRDELSRLDRYAREQARG
ncbi:MAG: SRPBCC family protein [Chloroflexi bacterium]|nr:SRPBCC family protein [Chloroflexota bacterium]